MISTSSLNGGSNQHSHPHIPLPHIKSSVGMTGLGRTADSQKFLVPSLPISSRPLASDGGKRRSILNGTSGEQHMNGIHKTRSVPYTHQKHHLHHHQQQQLQQQQIQQHHLHQQHQQNQHHHLYGSGSPRKDAHSPIYTSVHPSEGSSNYSGRSSMPIPCSSPSPGSSASPKSQSPVGNSGNSYSAQIPVGDGLTSSRLYSGGGGFHIPTPPSPHSHGLSPGFYAAMPYHQHLFSTSYSAAAAASYLENFHSNLTAGMVSPMRSDPSPPSRVGTYLPHLSPPQHLHHLSPPVPTGKFQQQKMIEERYTRNNNYVQVTNNHAFLNSQLPRVNYTNNPICVTSSSSSSNLVIGNGKINLKSGTYPPHVPRFSMSNSNREKNNNVEENLNHEFEIKEEGNEGAVGKVPFGKEGSLKHRILVRSPETPNDRSQSPTNFSNERRGSPSLLSLYPPQGILVDSNRVSSPGSKYVVSLSPGSNLPPPIPKRPRIEWNFALPPPMNHKESNGESNKYLSGTNPQNGCFKQPSVPTFAPSSPLLPSASTTPSSLKVVKNGTSGPVPVEKMPFIEAFKKGSLIQLTSGELRPVEDLRTEDFHNAAAALVDSIRIVHCTVLSIHVDNGINLSKVTLSIGSPKHQVVIEATPEQPFFILGRGWSSSSPLNTEKNLQLQCSQLAVGDICITLMRSIGGITAGIPKSTGVEKGAKGRKNSSILSSPKGNKASPGSSNNSNSMKPAIKTQRKRPAVLSLPPPTITADFKMLPPPSPMSVKKMMDENDRPCSPKRRRWSAPPDQTAIISGEKIETKS